MSDDVTETFGVNIHLTYLDTMYGANYMNNTYLSSVSPLESATVWTFLSDLGVRWIRDGVPSLNWHPALYHPLLTYNLKVLHFHLLSLIYLF